MLDAHEQQLREKDPTRPKMLFFSPEFLAYLLEERDGGATSKDLSEPRYDYSKVSNWFINEKGRRSKNIDVFAVERIFIPVHTINHWTLLVLHMKRKEMYYYDSLTGKLSQQRGQGLKKRLTDWMKDEAKAKKGTSDFVEADKWKISYPECPQQQTYFDCGVFTIMYARCLSSNRILNFSQSDINDLRNVFTIEVLQGYLKDI